MTDKAHSRRQILAAAASLATAAAQQQPPTTPGATIRRPIPPATIAFKDQKLITTIPIPKQSGRGVIMERGQRLKIINPRGKQIGDLFAFAGHSPDEFIAPSYTMTWNRNVYLKTGMPMISNYSNPLLFLEEDTSGRNDLFYPACSGGQKPGRLASIPNCRDNMTAALRAINFPVPPHPEIVHPHNIFQNSPVIDLDGRIEVREPDAKPGDYVIIRALENVVIVVTACSSPGIANAREPKELLLEVYA